VEAVVGAFATMDAAPPASDTMRHAKLRALGVSWLAVTESVAVVWPGQSPDAPLIAGATATSARTMLADLVSGTVGVSAARNVRVLAADSVWVATAEGVMA
jgi:hypothetical protein